MYEDEVASRVGRPSNSIAANYDDDDDDGDNDDDENNQ